MKKEDRITEDPRDVQTYEIHKEDIYKYLIRERIIDVEAAADHLTLTLKDKEGRISTATFTAGKNIDGKPCLSTMIELYSLDQITRFADD